MDNTSGIKRDLVIRRIVHATVEKVWEAWTEPEAVKKWWGPEDYTSPSAIVDLREGGKYVFAMQAPPDQGGITSYTAGIFQKIVPLQRLEFTQGLSDQDGNRIDPSELSMPADFPKELHTTIEFESMGEFTQLTITEKAWDMGLMYVYSYAGMQQSLDKLAGTL